MVEDELFRGGSFDKKCFLFGSIAQVLSQKGNAHVTVYYY